MEYMCTVLLITYNHATYIRNAIESVLNQKTKYPFIIKIFDDCSTDGSVQIIQEYANKYPGLIEVHISKTNKGPQTNFWNAFKSVDTKYCCILETDDYWCDNNKLELQISALENNPDCSFCSCQSKIKNIADNSREQEHDTELIKNEYVLSTHKISLDSILKQPVSTGYMPSATSRVIRTECLNIDNVKHKEAILFDNAQFYYLLLRGDMFFINKVMSVYNQTGTGTWSGASLLQRIRNYNFAMGELMQEINKESLKLRLYQEMASHINYCAYISNSNNIKKYKKSNKIKILKQLEHYLVPPIVRDALKPKTYIKLFKFLFVHR